LFFGNISFAQPTLAVLDFEGRNVSIGEALTLTDRFRNEIIKTNKYIVVERAAMDEVLKEQGFQQTGCTSNECAVEVGALLGVQQMIIGSIGKVGDIFTVSVRIIDIQTGKILNMTDYDIRGDISEMLIRGMREAAINLTKIKESLSTNRLQEENLTVTDIDGNVYKTVKIGNQIWMAENLKVTHYRNGDAIPTGHSNSEWSNLDNTQTGAYAVYDGNESIYGYLYNWYAVDDSRNIAPEGWHVPTDNEWQTLVDYLGGKRVAGGKLKEEGTTHWDSPNFGATNESGFTALPGGYRYGHDGSYNSMGDSGRFWSSAESGSYGAWRRLLSYDYSGVHRLGHGERSGFSVRCIRD